MNPDDIARILDDLGERIGPAGEYVFALAVRQQVITNALWTFALAAVLIGSIGIAVYTLRRTRRLSEVIDGIEAAVKKRDASTADVRAKIRDFEKERDDARLATMTDEERAEWFQRVSIFGGYGAYWSSSGPSVHDLRDHNQWSLGIVFGCTLTAAAASLGLLLVIPSLLTPEYAALRDILAAIGAGS